MAYATGTHLRQLVEYVWGTEVRVTEGQRVGEGEVVAVLESMKMHLELGAPRPGVVRTLRAAAGQEVTQGEVLAIIEDSYGEGR